MPKYEPTSAEYQQVLEENDALRIENVQLRRELKTKDQTIDHKSKRMGDLQSRSTNSASPRQL